MRKKLKFLAKQSEKLQREHRKVQAKFSSREGMPLILNGPAATCVHTVYIRKMYQK